MTVEIYLLEKYGFDHRKFWFNNRYINNCKN